MFKLGKNKYFVGGFAILMAVGLMAAYIPMLFPQTPAGSMDTVSGNADAISGAANLGGNGSLSGTDVQTTPPAASTTATSTDKSANLPASLSGLQNEQSSLNDIGNLLNQKN